MYVVRKERKMILKRFIKMMKDLCSPDSRCAERALWFMLTWVALGLLEWWIIKAQGFNSPWAIIIPLIFLQVVIGLWNDWLNKKRLAKRSRARHARNMQELQNDKYLWFEEK